MLISWVVFPALLVGLAIGIGLLVERLSGAKLPGALLAPLGFAGLVIAGQAVTALDLTAELAPWAALALAIAGFVLSPPWRRGSLDRPALLAGVGVFALFGAPVLLSGEATFAGYIKLDDTATWMALTDRVMEHGRSLDGLAPSTYEATLDFNLDEGYPIGAFVPLGIGASLTGTDVAWLIQPYIALWAAMLALALAALARGAGLEGPARFAVALIAAQPALLYGYGLWGGIKEVATASIIAALAALTPAAFASGARPRWSVAAAVCLAALAAVLSPAGLIWAVPLVGISALIAWRSEGGALTLRRGVALLGATAILSIPLLGASVLPPTSSPLTDSSAQGNLVEPLEPAQVAGIWPAADFRFSPGLAELAYALVILVAVAAVLGLVLAWGRGERGRALATYGGGTLLAGALIAIAGSPWAEAKAYAIASPAVLFLALVGAAMLARGRAVPTPIPRGRWLSVAGVAALVMIGAGVLWSNALAYGGVSLAPREQLAELEAVGERFPGDGPALLTEYQPYGARHFLRELDAEAASELRRHRVPLARGGVVEKGLSAETDELDWEGLRRYRTLILRRSPSRSRPPSPYRQVWRGEWYEVWQRGTSGGEEVVKRLGLGDDVSPVARAGPCVEVGALATAAGHDGGLRYAEGVAPVRMPLGRADYPEAWEEDRAGAALFPVGEGTASLEVMVPREGRWELWLRGSVRGELRASVDGVPLEPTRQVLNNEGQYVRLGSQDLEEGDHRVELHYAGPDLHPGSAGVPTAIGPLALSRGDPANAEVRELPAARARELCGRQLDWIEAVLP